MRQPKYTRSYYDKIERHRRKEISVMAVVSGAREGMLSSNHLEPLIYSDKMSDDYGK
jgi:hypothetical protein